MKNFILFVALVISLPPFTVHAADGDFPIILTVQEALYPATPSKNAAAGVVAKAATGMNRVQDPLTVGIPIPDSQNITSESQLGLSGATVGQFKILGRWPSGNAKWVLVDTQMDISAGQKNQSVAVTTGGGNFGGVNLATDLGATIAINTGPAQFIVNKSSTNIIDQAVVNGNTLVASGQSQGVVVVGPTYPNTVCGTPPTDCTTEYSSTNDPSSTAVIEENGPVRSAVKIDGALKDSAGNTYLRYTYRLHFFKGKSFVKIVSTLRNADFTATSNNFISAFKGFASYEMRFTPNLGSGRFYSISNHTATPTAGTLSTGQQAYLYQAHSMRFDDVNAYAYDVVPFYKKVTGTTFVQEGYKIIQDSTTLLTGTKTDYHDGWVDVSDSSGAGIEAGIYQMSAYNPKSLQLVDGGDEIRIGLWPNQTLSNQAPADAIPYYIAWPQHNIDEFYLNFHSSALSNPKNEFLKYQHPLVAHASNSHYNAAEVFPVTLVDSTVEDQYYRAIGSAAGFSSSQTCCQIDFEPAIFHRYGWSGGGGDNQSDFRWDYLLQFIRRDRTGRYLWAKHFNRYIIEKSLPRSDDFNWRSSPSTKNTLGYPQTISLNGTKATRVWLETLHDHIYGIMDWYYVTGDRAYLDFIQDTMPDRYLDFNIRLNQALPGMAGYLTTTRDLGIHIINGTRMKLFFNSIGDTALAAAANQLVDNLLTPVVQDLNVSGTGPSNVEYGTSRTRGLFYAFARGNQQDIGCINTVYTNTRWAPPYQIGMLIQGLQETIKERGPNWSQRQLISDLAYGMSLWAVNEMGVDTGSVTGSGLRYGNSFDHTGNNQCDMIPGAQQSVWYIWAYLADYAGDLSKKNVFERVVQRNYGALSGTNWSEYQNYGIMNAMAHLTGIVQRPGFVNVSTTVSDLGGGSYQLSWTPPPGVLGYKLKYSPTSKNVVDWLNFNPMVGTEPGIGGTFGLSPDTNMPWFAATPTSVQPTAGQTSITLTGLPTGLSAAKFGLKAHIPQANMPAIISNGSPSGVRPSGTTSVTLSVATNKNATCKYGSTPNVAFASKTTFSTTGGVTHSQNITGLTDGGSYAYYIRCSDGSGNTNTSDYSVTFSVGNPATTDTIAPSSPTGLQVR